MPLPAALLERLKKRGIVTEDRQSSQQQEQRQQEYHEEVIAEDYDDEEEKEEEDKASVPRHQEPSVTIPAPSQHYSSFLGKHSLLPVSGCPNKINVYHDCSDYCASRFGNGKEVPSPRTERRYRKLIKRFPLPNEWQDVWEPGTGYYYFWNTKTDEVSWLPPLHPKARVTVSVNKMRNLLKEKEELESDDSDSDEDDSNDSDDDSGSSSSSEEEEKKSQTGLGFKNKSIAGRRKPVLQRNDLDPMDPAAYSSECPRGKWSDGLNNRQREGTKAADTTASGPLFQMRPYPSPGDVLKMNKEKK